MSYLDIIDNELDNETITETDIDRMEALTGKPYEMWGDDTAWLVCKHLGLKG